MKRNDLKDFLDLIPSDISVEESKIVIDDILEFHDITRMFAFCFYAIRWDIQSYLTDNG